LVKTVFGNLTKRPEKGVAVGSLPCLKKNQIARKRIEEANRGGGKTLAMSAYYWRDRYLSG